MNEFLDELSGSLVANAEEVTVNDIINSDLVIYSFDRNEMASTLSQIEAIRIFMVRFLDTKKQAVRKSKKLYKAAFYEDLQRAEVMPDLVTYLKESITGSRSNNVLLFLLINVLEDSNMLLDTIRTSVTTKVIGNCTSEDVKILVNKFGCKNIEEDLRMLIEDKNGFDHRFVIDFDTGKTRDKSTYKVFMPKDFESRFKTRDTLGE